MIKDNSTPSQRVFTSSLALNREQRKHLNFNCNLSDSISLWRPLVTRKRYEPECQCKILTIHVNSLSHNFKHFFIIDYIIFLHSNSIGPANSSVGRVSDCSSEGRRFKPGLADVKPR